MKDITRLRQHTANCMKRNLLPPLIEEYCLLHIKEAGTYQNEKEWKDTNQRHGEWGHIGLISEMNAGISLGKHSAIVIDKVIQYKLGIDIINEGKTYQVKTARIGPNNFYVKSDFFNTTAEFITLVDNQLGRIITSKAKVLETAFEEFGNELPTDVFDAVLFERYNIPKVPE